MSVQNKWSLKLSSMTLLIYFLSTASVSAQTLISPMVGGLDICPSALNGNFSSLDDAGKYCEEINETSAVLLEKALQMFGPKKSADEKFEVGYTLGLPLLKFIDFNEDNSFSINKSNIAHRIQLLKDTDRQAVVYLFSNHFSVSSDAVTEEKIIKLDPESLMQMSDGSSPIDGYFSSKTYPWAIDADGTLIDKVRTAAMKEVLTQLCELDDADKDKIHAVTVLGESHHMYPDFFGGMGYNTDFIITDYSPSAVARFQQYLKDKYQTIEGLNKVYQADFSEFISIQPPSKNINKDKLESFFQHIDYASSGKLALHGWAADEKNEHINIKIYVDGKYHGDAEYGLNRMDVYQAKPELKNAAVGYRYYLNIKDLAYGIHKVDIVHDNKGELTLMASVDVPVMDRKQTTPKQLAKGVKFKKEQALDFWHDYPKNMEPVYYNPLYEDFYKYRQVIVVNEITKFANMVNESCIDKDKVFSHQIAPMLNSDWNEEKISVDQSLEKNDAYNIGFNTYGAAFYGSAVFDWLKVDEIIHYGIPEMHPMVKDKEIIITALDKHHDQGALFLSPYYIELKPVEYGVDKEHSKFEVNDQNKSYDSKSFFDVINEIMTR